ncbi:hypothetical protein [Gloeocapsopsis sp. IPPAS B-1203]|uniref:hypothetical protein n=1 Tax=Gloeocapsopsis sp. IPPAS B-1203 TaxID=2049454 RepID=UPI0025A09D56|nr:hypothetical protein [Gloeocapsopsis sp. IPPAS B-1203]
MGVFRAGYQPQSRDTHPEVDKFLMRAFRNMPVWKKQLAHVSPLLVAMGKDFFIDEGMVTEAIECQSSFNVIHLESMQKADIFLLSNHPLAKSEMQRRQQLIITQNPER